MILNTKFFRNLLLLAAPIFVASPGLSMPVQNLVTYHLKWSGSSFGNNASAEANIVIDTTQLPNPSTPGPLAPLDGVIQQINLTVTGASSGNGLFQLADFSGYYWDTNGGTLDLTTQLVGQLTPTGPWGFNSGSSFGDWNLANESSNAPNGAAAFTLTTDGGSGDAMALISFAPAANKLFVSELGGNQVTGLDLSGAPLRHIAINGPQGVAFDSEGNLFTATSDGSIIKTALNGTQTTFFTGLNNPTGMHFGPDGNLYVAELGSGADGDIRQISADGSSSSVWVMADTPYDFAFDASGYLYVPEFYAGEVLQFSPDGLSTSLFASNLDGPDGLAFDSAGNLYVSDWNDGTIQKISPDGLDVSTFATGLDGPEGLAFDGFGNLYVANLGTFTPGTKVTKITPDGTVSTFADVFNGANYLAFGSVAENFTAVVTNTAENVTSYSATLGGALVSGSSITDPFIEWGTDTNYTGAAAASEISPLSYSATIGSAGALHLSRDTEYHYRFAATVDGVIAYGADLTFTTSHNEAPVAHDHRVSAPTKPVSLTIHPLAEATDADDDLLQIVSVTKPTAGSVVILNPSTLVYTPNSRYSSGDSFTYTISDGFDGTSTAKVVIRNPYLGFAGTYQALIATGDSARDGYASIAIGKLGAFTLTLKTADGSYTAKGNLGADGQASVSIPRVDHTSLTVSLLLDFEGSGFSIQVDDGTGAVTASFTQKVLFSVTNPAPQLGNFTMMIPPPAQIPLSQATGSATVENGKVTGCSVDDSGYGYVSIPNVTITGTSGKGSKATAILTNGQVSAITVTAPGSKYPASGVTVSIDAPSGLPQGYGYAIMSVNALGAITVTGKLGDGTGFTAGSWVNANYNWNNLNHPYADATQSFPIYSKVYSAPSGRVSGNFIFEDEPGVSDFDGEFNWTKPAQTSTKALFNRGFEVAVTAIGSSYTPFDSPDYILDLNAGANNALITLRLGNLSAPLSKGLTLGTAPLNTVVAALPGTDAIAMSFTQAKGSFSGTFVANPLKPSKTAFGGVVFQKQNLGIGTFLGTSQAGAVILSAH